MNFNEDHEFQQQLRALQPAAPDLSVGQLMFAAGRSRGEANAIESSKSTTRIWQICSVVFAVVAGFAWLPGEPGEQTAQMNEEMESVPQTDNGTHGQQYQETSVEANPEQQLTSWIAGVLNQGQFGRAFDARNKLIADGVDGLPELQTDGFSAHEPILTIRGSRESPFGGAF